YALGSLVWSDTFYDANDNIIRQVSPHYGSQDTFSGPTTTTTYDAMDHKTQVANADASADPAGERTQYTYDAAGRMASTTLPKGVLAAYTANDFATFYGYDALDRVTSQTRYTVDGSGNITQTLTTVACYN